MAQVKPQLLRPTFFFDERVEHFGVTAEIYVPHDAVDALGRLIAAEQEDESLESDGPAEMKRMRGGAARVEIG